MTKELNQVKSRSFYSAISLVGQSAYSAALGFTAFFVLTLKSGVHLLGIYSTVLSIMSFFNYFTDLGLAAAIMQKKEVEEIDLNTSFYIQLALTTLAVIVGFFLTSKLFIIYKDLPHQATYLYWAVLGAFFLLSLKSIPSVLLEKKIEIYKVVFVQTIENTVFYGIVIVMLLLGYDIMSLVVAVLVRSVIGLILIFYFNPWFPKLQFSFPAAKKLLKYGIPFQSNSFLALIKDDLLIVYLGSRIGFRNLGYVTFAKKYGEFAIRLVMDNINRVAFPLFSRFQDNKELLKKSLQKVLFYESLLIFPIVVGALFVFDSLLKVIPGYYEKWQPAIISFYFFSLSAFFVSLTTPFINLFNAVGKVKWSVYFMVLWTIFIWASVPLAIDRFGYQGISMAFFLMSLTFIIVYYAAKKILDFSLQHYIKETSIATLFMFIYLVIIRYLFINVIGNVYLQLILSLLGAGLIYIVTMYWQVGRRLIDELRSLININKNG